MSEPTVIIYQIGNMPIHMHEQLWQTDTHKSDGKALDLAGSYKFLWADQQFLPALRTTQVTGMLLGSCGMPAAAVLQHLKRMVGHPVPIIGWWDDGCCGGLCPCQCSGKGCTAVWVENYGVLRGVSVSNKNGLTPSITLDVEFGAYWQPLSRIQWAWSNAYTTNPSDIPTVMPGQVAGDNMRINHWDDAECPWGLSCPDVVRTDYWQYLSALPRCDMLYRNGCMCEGFAYQGWSEYTMLNPKTWEYHNTYHAPAYPSTGYAQTWTPIGISSAKSVAFDFSVQVDKWGAPPNSLYAFTDLNINTTVSIFVDRPDGLYGRRQEWTKLETTELHQSLINAGVGALRNDDIIIIGDMDRMPGVILRNFGTSINRRYQILEDIRPLPVFDGAWPGYLEPGRCRVTIGMTGGGKFAFKHEWRRL